MKNIAILASGSGTNAENMVRYFAANKLIKVAVVLSNHAHAGVHGRVNALGVPSFTFSKEDFAAATPILDKLAAFAVDFVVLAGFMSKIPDALLAAFPERVVNIHPALLPKFGGKGMYGHHVHEAMLAAGESESGITIHYVNAHYDEGKILFQAACPVLPDDTPDTLAQRVHQLEYAHYPRVVEQLLTLLPPLHHKGE